MLSIDDRGPASPCPAPFNLAAHVLAGGASNPDRPALVRVGGSNRRTLHHGELAEAVLALAGRLTAKGLPAGSRVLLRFGNTPDFPVAFLAAAAADLVPVVISSLLTAPEIARIGQVARPMFALVDPRLPRDRLPCPANTLDELGRLDASPLPDPVPGDPDRPGFIVFTSGTSADPVPVLHAHRAIWARRMMWQGWYDLSERDRVLHAGAFNWTFTLGTGLLDPWAAGATALVPEEGLPPEALAEAIADHAVTIFAGAPAVYRRMLGRVERIHAPDLRHGLSAGEKLSDRLRTRWIAATGCPVHEAFGMSECSTFISGSPTTPAPPGTLGRAQLGRCVAVLDATGAPVPRGTSGRLAVDLDDPGLMLGYLKADGTEQMPRAGRWFMTADTVTMGAGGEISYEGRSDDMLNAGGVRVSPVEVENALSEHPSVADCAVAEVSVKRDTTVIAAFCVSEAPLDETALSEHMARRLARYKTPRLFVRVESLPRNTNGKLKRRDLREAWESTHDQA